MSVTNDRPALSSERESSMDKTISLTLTNIWPYALDGVRHQGRLIVGLRWLWIWHYAYSASLKFLPKRRQRSTRLQCDTTEKTVIITVTAVSTSKRGVCYCRCLATHVLSPLNGKQLPHGSRPSAAHTKIKGTEVKENWETPEIRFIQFIQHKNWHLYRNKLSA
jgi:hypothetical protein